MKLTKQKLLTVAVLTVLVATGVVTWQGTQSPEGAYQPEFSCGCDSHNFYHFQNGQIYLYLGNHPPRRIIGTYGKTNGSWWASFATKTTNVVHQIEPHAFFLRYFGRKNTNEFQDEFREPRLWKTRLVLNDAAQFDDFAGKAATNANSSTPTAPTEP